MAGFPRLRGIDAASGETLLPIKNIDCSGESCLTGVSAWRLQRLCRVFWASKSLVIVRHQIEDKHYCIDFLECLILSISKDLSYFSTCTY